jgi:hypothetical protein
MHGRGKKVYRVLVGRPEGKKHLQDLGVGGRMGIRIDLRETGWGCAVDSPCSG